MKSDSLILMGKIAATHGIRGQLRVIPYSADTGNLLSCDTLIIKDAKGGLNVHGVAKAVMHSNKLLVTLKDFNDINLVIPFVGSEVLLRKDQLLEPDEDEYYWHDLIGLKVVTVDGQELGILESIIETGSNDVYVVSANGREYLIPALADVVSIDIVAKIITVTPFEGLFDL